MTATEPNTAAMMPGQIAPAHGSDPGSRDFLAEYGRLHAQAARDLTALHGAGIRRTRELHHRVAALEGELDDARDDFTFERNQVIALRAALSSLTDRAEAGNVITADEAHEYRQLTGTDA